MNEKFGEFGWKCWKDSKPDRDKYIYVFYSDYPTHRIMIGEEEDFDLDEYDYWCYVFIPDAPVIEKELTLEERIKLLEMQVDKLKEICNERG